MPLTPTLPGAKRTTIFFTPDNKAHLVEISVAKAQTLFFVLNAELDYPASFGLITPYLRELERQAKAEKTPLGDYVAAFLVRYAQALPAVASPAEVAPSTVGQAPMTEKTSVALAPHHYARLEAFSRRQGCPLSLPCNQELDFARTYGLPHPLLLRLRRAAAKQGCTLREFVQLLLMEHLTGPQKSLVAPPRGGPK